MDPHCKFNEILKSKGFKIISIDCFPSHYTYYIRKLEKEKVTKVDYNDLYKINGYSISNMCVSDYYIEFDLSR